ncbi:MAG: hypothetical protein ACRDYE_14285 [Acidimicrobiales bacterium]
MFRTVQQTGGGSRQLPWGSAELSLLFDERGIQISGERRGEHSVLPWASVTRVSRGATVATPDGGSVTVIGIESPGRIMRFAVTSDRRDPIQLTALSEMVGRWSASTAPAAPAPDVPQSPLPHPSPLPPLAVPDPPGPPTPPAAHPVRPEVGPSAGAGLPGDGPVSEPRSDEVPPTPPALYAPSVSTAPALVPAPAAVPVSAVMVPAPAAVPASVVVPWPPDRFYGQVPPPPRRNRRHRRITLLVVALFCLASGAGLAVALSGSGGPKTSASPAAPPPTPDQILAGRLMLTRSDLPAGWTVGTSGTGTGSSPRVQTGESKITRVFAACMGISQSQAAMILGGAGSDQTAQTSSPVFVGPAEPDRPGYALEVQTAATIVRSHHDEQSDFAGLADPLYPSCEGAAVASETQLGADSSSGRNAKPGPSSVSAIDLPAPVGEQVSGLLVAFSVTDRSASVPVEVETVSLGHDRIEANLQALAIGGQISPAALSSALSIFEQRVTIGGSGTEA